MWEKEKQKSGGWQLIPRTDELSPQILPYPLHPLRHSARAPSLGREESLCFQHLQHLGKLFLISASPSADAAVLMLAALGLLSLPCDWSMPLAVAPLRICETHG